MTQAASDSLVLKLPDESPAPRDLSLWAAVLVLLTLVAYWPATQAGFIWDDNRHVTQNQSLKSPDGWNKIWLKRWTTPNNPTIPVQYYPLTHSVFRMIYGFARDSETGKVSPLPFHIANLICHAGSVVLLWLILRRLRLNGAWLAAAVFALHPLNVESVAWVSELKNCLAGLLFFAAIYLHLWFVDEDARRDKPTDPSVVWTLYCCGLLLLTLAMLSKTIACAMPVAALAILWWKQRLNVRHFLLLLPHLAIGIALGLATATMEREHVGARGPDWDFTTAQHILIAGRAVWFYIAKLLLPINLAFTYDKWELNAGEALQWLFPVAVVAALIGLWMARRRFGRAPMAAAIIYGACLFPALGFFRLFPMKYSFVADHFSYLAIAAPICLIVGGMAHYFGKRAGAAAKTPIAMIVAIPAALLLVLGIATHLRSDVFYSELTVWRDAASKSDHSWLAKTNLAAALADEARRNLAIVRDAKAASSATTAPAMLPAVDPSAIEQAETDANAELAEAWDLYWRALQIHRSFEPLWGLGTIKEIQGQEAAAIDYLQQARQTDQGDRKSIALREHLAKLLIHAGQTDEALAVLDEAKEAAPIPLPMLYRLSAEAYEKHSDWPHAIVQQLAALRIQPEAIEVREHLADLLVKTGNLPEAATNLRIIAQVETQRNRPELWYNLGVVYARMGNFGVARQFFKTALGLRPDYPSAQKAFDETERQLRIAATRAATQSTTQNQMP